MNRNMEARTFMATGLSVLAGLGVAGVAKAVSGPKLEATPLIQPFNADSRFSALNAIAPAVGQSTEFLADRCGGDSFTAASLVANWERKGVIDDIIDRYGIPTVDETVEQFVRNHWGRATLVNDKTVNNWGCKDGQFVAVGKKTLPGGFTEWVGIDGLKKAYPEGFSLTPKEGYKRIIVTAPEKAGDECANPRQGQVEIWVWILPKKKKTPPPPPPKQPPITTEILKSLVTAREYPTLVPTGKFDFLMRCLRNGQVIKQAWIKLNGKDLDRRPEYYRQKAITCPADTDAISSREKNIKNYTEENPYVIKRVKNDGKANVVDEEFAHKNKEEETPPPEKPPVTPQAGDCVTAKPNMIDDKGINVTVKNSGNVDITKEYIDWGDGKVGKVVTDAQGNLVAQHIYDKFGIYQFAVFFDKNGNAIMDKGEEKPQCAGPAKFGKPEKPPIIPPPPVIPPGKGDQTPVPDNDPTPTGQDPQNTPGSPSGGDGGGLTPEAP